MPGSNVKKAQMLKNVKRKSYKSDEKRIPRGKLKKYQRGRPLDPHQATKFKKYKKRLEKQDKKIKESVKFAARSELLLLEEKGYLEPDENESTYQISQKDIVDLSDITTQTKHFELKLDYGPYKMNYFNNGRKLLLGGRQGHVAGFDWVTKDLICEFNVREFVYDVQWLHMPTMFAVAQADWVYIYDDMGTELHCVKRLYRVRHLEFLPYHFLLVSGSDNGYLSYLDVSVGTLVSNMKLNRPSVSSMTQNRHNAVIATAHSNGTVALWSPSQTESLMSVLCHGCAVRDIAFDDLGCYMTTIGVDRTLNIWDTRYLKPFYTYKLDKSPTHIDISQQNLLAVSMGDIVEVYNNPFSQTVHSPYMRHRLDTHSVVSGVEFCRYEDVLGLGHNNGFTSLIIPGAGEPNFDTLESNPFMTKSQRREMEVKSLLDKIPPDLITLDPMELVKVDLPRLKQNLKDKQKVNYVRPKNIEFVNKKKRTKTARKIKINKGIKQQMKRTKIKNIVQSKRKKKPGSSIKKDKKKVSFKGQSENSNKNVLDRFKKKD